MVTLSSEEFYSQVLEAEPAFVEGLVGGLYAGDLYLVKGAFSREDMDQIRLSLFDFAQSNPSSFHKMLDGTPDFHRIINENTTESSPDGYSLRALRHGFHFYRWNGDPLNLFEKFKSHWQTLKVMSGLAPDAYEPNLPSDGVVDRIVCYRYPPGGGNLRRHLDPTNNHKYFTGIMLSERGVDYEEGGIYCVDTEGEIFDLEPWIKPGDFCFAYPTVEHGVLPVDPDKQTDWAVPDGRWFVGFSSVDSDCVENRKSGTHID
ncbi:MAG: hypothetical protein HQ513_11445 [Rhodospirillales bacterium]|nr:hypothetical protein [Rhodospirillales bacterium]